MKTPKQLIADYLDDALSEVDQTDFNSWLKADPAHMRRFTEAVSFEQQIRAAVQGKAVMGAREIARIAQLSKPIRADFNRPKWLVKAAAWTGAFHIFSNTAKAATATSSTTTSTTVITKSTIAILMKKTVTSVTAAILVLGGSGIYVIHRNNETSRNRLATMETEIQSLSDQLGIKTTSLSSRRAGITNSQKNVSISQIVAIYNDRHRFNRNRFNRQEAAVINQFKKQLAGMDAEALKNLILDAEKLSNPMNGNLLETIMDELISKDPAEATRLATQLNSRDVLSHIALTDQAEDAFRAWLASDPAAADAWYLATAAEGGFFNNTIPENGREDYTIDRRFARLRFVAQMKANPAEAAAMMATMLPDDVTTAMKEVTDPATLQKFLPDLPLERRGPAAEGAIKAMAASDLKAAFTWANSLEMTDRDRSTLLATGIEAAVENGKLDLAGVSEWSKGLNFDPKRRAEMLVSAAADISAIPGKINQYGQNNVAWNQASERIDWLRKEAPAEAAEEAVGKYLGSLFVRSLELDQALKAYEQEVARQGTTNPDLTMAFASFIEIAGDDNAKATALKLVQQLPPSEKRDDMIRLMR